MVSSKEQLLLSAVERQLEADGPIVDLDSTIEELGLDSLKFMMLILDLQEKHEHLVIDIKRVGQVVTVRDLADIFDEAH
jgi:acyl carrier protein